MYKTRNISFSLKQYNCIINLFPRKFKMVYFDLKNNNTLPFFKLVVMAILTHNHIFFLLSYIENLVTQQLATPVVQELWDLTIKEQRDPTHANLYYGKEYNMLRRNSETDCTMTHAEI